MRELNALASVRVYASALVRRSWMKVVGGDTGAAGALRREEAPLFPVGGAVELLLLKPPPNFLLRHAQLPLRCCSSPGGLRGCRERHALGWGPLGRTGGGGGGTCGRGGAGGQMSGGGCRQLTQGLTCFAASRKRRREAVTHLEGVPGSGGGPGVGWVGCVGGGVRRWSSRLREAGGAAG